MILFLIELKYFVYKLIINNSMNELTQIIQSKIKSIPSINSSVLPQSGTGYIYPVHHDEKIVKFIESGRIGYLVQITIRNLSAPNNTNELTTSCFVIHKRWSDSDYTIAYSGPNEFYNDCIVRDHDKTRFNERFQALVNGDVVGQWHTNDDNDNETPNYEFVLGASTDMEAFTGRHYLTCVGKSELC